MGKIERQVFDTVSSRSADYFGHIGICYWCWKGGGIVAYWHAKELLDNGRGVLVPFRDSKAIADGVSDLLDDLARMKRMQNEAFALGRDMIWSVTGRRYLESFQNARAKHSATLPFGIRGLDDGHASAVMAPAGPAILSRMFDVFGNAIDREFDLEGEELYREIKEAGVLKDMVMIFGQMNEPQGARFRVGHAALTITEYFRDNENRDVLLLVDNIFRFIQAGMEVS